MGGASVLAAPAWHLLIFAPHPSGAKHPGAGPGGARVFLLHNRCGVGQVLLGRDRPTLSRVPCWHRWPRPTEEAAEALSLPGALPGNHQARGSDWRLSERGWGRGRGASCEEEGEEEGDEA